MKQPKPRAMNWSDLVFAGLVLAKLLQIEPAASTGWLVICVPFWIYWFLRAYGDHSLADLLERIEKEGL